MSNIQKMFVEFKSIFFSENLLKENEEHANKVAASTMLNIFWIFLITWVLTYLNVFKIGMEIMNIVMVRCILLLVVPAIICYANKGKGKWIKHLLFISFIIMLAIADAILKYNVTLVMVLPIILAARYYKKRFTISVAIATTIAFTISAWISIQIGQQDINTYNLIIPKGTTITVESTLREAVTKVDVNEDERLKNEFIHFLLPKILVFNIVAFACAQISQSGKNMIEKQAEITKKGARIETELGLANAIQKNMLPSIFPPFPEHSEFDIYASMTPAKEVGGDFYDMFLIDDSHLAVAMADVSGKGIPASLFMMISKILIKNVSTIDREVDKAITRVNNMLCDGNKTGLFVTAWFGILNLKNGKLEFVNAGHNPPLLYSEKVGEFEYLRTKPNMVLAGMENIQYRKNEIQIEPGDKLFLYTDGVTEATNINNKLYGEERLQIFLNSHLDLGVEETIKKLKADIDHFSGKAEQFDDITMLELLYKGKNPNIVQRKFNADIKELSNVQEFINGELEKYNCSNKNIRQLDIVIEEIFVNISSYAYKGNEGDCNVIVQYDDNRNVTLIFEDNGIPFNPLEKKEPDISLSANERNIGGLGIFMTKKMMDDVQYRRDNNKNILIITKQI
ncbi:MAG: SpoIIE family protein phosphatase [Clostridia bacterium]|nr:SpoIIE family protein phosphatase [Clostridia bacterium]